MESNLSLFIHLLLCFALFSNANSDEEINRSQFPKGFIFGTASSSYQIEGAVFEDGKGVSNWDVFSHTPGAIVDGSDADIADDHYHRYEEDINLMQTLGVNAYRFSVSWSRILPRGRFGDVNPLGIMFYNKIIDILLLKGIEPYVTLHHYESPQELEERYGTWLSPLIQEDFAYFAEICFRSFGDRVKSWATFNEPILYVQGAYLNGLYPPGHCSAPFGNCSHGDSDTEPLMAMHNIILSHAKAVDIYRRLYQPKQGGHIGIVTDSMMYEPFSDAEADREAAKRALAFNVAWILDPVVFGDYPQEMRFYLGDQLPKFSPEESNKLKNSTDFIGFNYYSSLYAKDCLKSVCPPGGDHAVRGFLYPTGERHGIPIGERTVLPRFFIVPGGFEKIIAYLKTRYNNMPMFVAENGFPDQDDPNAEVDGKKLNDFKRISHFKSYFASLARAIKDGADVRGYFLWSLMDNFEWNYGYIAKFGLYQVDYNTLERKPKLSASWFRDFLSNNNAHIDEKRMASLSSKIKDGEDSKWEGVEADM